MKEIYAHIGDLERAMGGRLGLYAAPLDDPERGLRVHEEEPFPAASTIKVFVLLTLFEQVQAGLCRLEDELLFNDSDKVPGSGVLKTLTAGRRYTLRDLMALMIVVSDNTATNLLIEHLEVSTISEVCERRGWGATKLYSKLQTPASVPSETSPRDLGDFFGRLWRGELLEPPLTRLAQHIFSQQQHTELGRDLDFDSYSTETGEADFVIASKSGALRGVRNDAGVISAGGSVGGSVRGLRYVISVMSRDCPDRRFHPNNKGSLAIASVSKIVFDYFSNKTL